MMKEHWQAPCTAWVKINMDGSMWMITLRVVISGVVRGPIGSWMVGFEIVTEMSDIFQNEALNMKQILKEDIQHVLRSAINPLN
ncbi:hypothetical protein PVK06_045568 [Gossypium arboreum]|uniref:RNase H type-1 domain-containing protein n=1 Tax=Gossypium arboreum TaxID=29729 RepID=A0ABR0MUE8_GOSAR|nr:hypothetical protein PVK06_045568 [Gossypium arboreum]